MLQNQIKGCIKDFKRVSGSLFEITIERDKSYEMQARVKIPLNYPDCPPSFQLTMKKHTFHPRGNELILSRVDQGDLLAVSSLRQLQSNTQPADLLNPNQEPIQPILESIQDELHVFNDEFCSINQRDWLLSFQIRKLTQCLDILTELSGEKGSDKLNGIYRQAVKGRFKKRPLSYNYILNILESQ